MFERFTKRARAAVVMAQAEARRVGHDRVGTEDLLLGLLTNDDGIAGIVLRELGVTTELAARVIEERAGAAGGGGLGDSDAAALAAIGIDLDEIRGRAEAAFGPGALDQTIGRSRRGHLPFTGGAKQTLKNALGEALRLRHNYIGTEHILLGLLDVEQDPGAAEVLAALGIVPEAVRDGVLTELRKAS
jgi:hypothetical protein